MLIVLIQRPLLRVVFLKVPLLLVIVGGRILIPNELGEP